MSIASTNIAVRSLSRLPKASASDSRPPGLMPKLKRPSSIWSSIAICEATAAGCVLGMFTVPVPRRMDFVNPARLAMNRAQEVMFSAASVACSPT
jgi:hypothetical protein